jgi:adenylate cyclase
MELTPRLRLMNWLVRQGLTGLPGQDLVRGFCERCRAEGLELSRGLVFIDTLHPVFEGHGFRWNDTETNESDSFDYGSTEAGDAAANWRRTTFHYLLEHGRDELLIDLADCDKHDFSAIGELAAKGHKHFVCFVHRFGEAGAMGQMDCVYSYWVTRRDEGFGAQGLAALRDLVPVLGLAIKSAAQMDVARTLGRVYLGRDASEQVLRGRIARGVTERINAVLWFSDLRGSTAISESIEPDAIIPFLNDYAQASIDAIHDAGGEVLKLMGDGVLAMFTDADMAVAKRAALRAEHRFRHNMAALNARRTADGVAVTTAHVGLHVGEVFYGNIGSEDRSISPWSGPPSTRSAASPRCVVRSTANCWRRRRSAPGSTLRVETIWCPPAALRYAASAARRISIRSIPTSPRTKSWPETTSGISEARQAMDRYDPATTSFFQGDKERGWPGQAKPGRDKKL